jgi:hypothetical protein
VDCVKFSEVEAVRVPNGSVVEIKSNGLVMWDNCIGRYVSFGDSIAAGHAINEDWEKDTAKDRSMEGTEILQRNWFLAVILT